MTLQLIFRGSKSAAQSMDYLNIEHVDSWSIAGSLLAVVQTGQVRYYPLCNLESFTELE